MGRVEARRGAGQRLALDVDVAVPEHDVDPAAVRRAGAGAAAAGDEDEEQRRRARRSERLMGAPPIVSDCGGLSGRGRGACASAIASRWARTSEASGSASGSRRVAPVARMSASRSGSISPIGNHERAGVGERDRPVPVLHRGVRLAPRAGSLAQLQRSLARPARSSSRGPGSGSGRSSAGSIGQRPPRARVGGRDDGGRVDAQRGSAAAPAPAVANRVWTTDRSSAKGSDDDRARPLARAGCRAPRSAPPSGRVSPMTATASSTSLVVPEREIASSAS